MCNMETHCAQALCSAFFPTRGWIGSLSLENRKEKGSIKLTPLNECLVVVSFTGNFEYGFVSSSIVESG
jgi:hypothetical protein